MPILSDKPDTISEESKKQLKIPESFLKSIQTCQNQMNEMARTVNRAMIPISPILPALKRMAEVANETRARLQPFTSLYTREFTLPPPQLSYQILRHQEFPNKEEIAEEVIKKIEERKAHKTNEHTVVYLSKDGDLYTTEKHRYPLQDAKKRLRLIRILSYQFQPTRGLIFLAEFMNAESLYKTIQAINIKVRNLLKIKADLIDGRRGSGYRINSKIKLIRQ